MASMIPIEFNGVQYALLFPKQPLEEGVHFLTPSSMPLQLGLLVHPAEKYIKPHVHRNQDKLVHSTYEVLFVIEGRIEIQFYSPVGKLLGVQQMAAGDVIILMNGGHGLRVLERCCILEVKQGPYYGVEAEKVYLSEEQL